MKDIAIATMRDGGILYQRSDGSTYTMYPNASGVSTPTKSYASSRTNTSTAPYSAPSQPAPAPTPTSSQMSKPSFSTPQYTIPRASSKLNPSFSSMIGQFQNFSIVPKANAYEGSSTPGSNTFTPTPVPTPNLPQGKTYDNVLGMTTDQTKPRQSNVVSAQGVPVASHMSGMTMDKYGNLLNEKAYTSWDTANKNAASEKPADFYNPSDPTNSMKSLEDELYLLVDEGKLSAEEAAQRWAEESTNILMDTYNVSRDQALAMIPEYEKWRDEQTGRLRRDLGEYKTSAEERKVDTENRYGEMIRRGVGNQKVLDANRRNMFSSLGSAESSAFMEQQFQADKAFGETINMTEQEKMRAVGEIDKMVLQQETKVNDMITDLETQAQQQIQQVYNNINMQDAEKRAAIAEITQQLNENLFNIENSWNQQKQGMLQYQYELAGQQQLLAQQGNLDQSLLRLQSELDRQDKGLESQMPTELEMALQNFARAGYSGPKAKSLQDQLMADYPQYAPLIQSVFSGMPFNPQATFSGY
jgi:hypothetical protein